MTKSPALFRLVAAALFVAGLFLVTSSPRALGPGEEPQPPITDPAAPESLAPMPGSAVQPSAEQAAPATAKPESLMPGHAKQATHHKKTAKKKTHKASARSAHHHKKLAKKSAAHHHAKHKKAHKASPAKNKSVAAPPKKTAPAVESATLAPVATPAEPKTTEAAPKPKTRQHMVASPAKSNAAAPVRTVAYNFCLGYDNCVPHKYEAVLQGNHVATSRVMQQSADGNWSEAKIDPVMAGDLNRMAATEAGGSNRDLTPNEKERIADHQGKMHAELVGATAAGAAGKEQAKTMMRQLGITNLDQLKAYDSKLAANENAVSAVNELATEHAAGAGHRP